jgi:hypothetical protein
MTLYQFNVLSEDEKAAVLWSKGDIVGDSIENNFSILLYQIRSFYVELYYSGKKIKLAGYVLLAVLTN